MADQLVSSDPGWAGATDAATPHIGAPPEDRPVTLGDLREDPGKAIARIGTILKKDISDPRMWVGLAAAYFAPKVFNAAAPWVARAAMKTSAATAELATPGMGKDLGITVLGDARVNAGLRIAGRVRSALQAATGGEAAPAEPAPASAAVPTPAVAPPAAAPMAEAPTAGPVTGFNMGSAMADVSKVFKGLGTAPQPAEVNNAASMMRFGKTAEEAVARVIAMRPAPMSATEAAAKLAARFGTPSDADVASTIAARNARR